MVLIKKMGRAKIPITWIKSDASRHVTFTKRKKGLKKKVEELAILCGVEVCMICFGPQVGKPSSTPYSWGLPGVNQVINKYRSLSKEEQDKKKLDNTSLLEQQIKKLRTELKLKMEQNRNLENERAYFLWDNRLNNYGVEELKQLADMVHERKREVYEKMSFLSQQQEVLQGFGNVIDHRPQMAVDGSAIPVSAVNLLSSNPIPDLDVLGSCPINHELMMPSQAQFQQLFVNPSYNTPDNASALDGLISQNPSASASCHGLFNQISLLSSPFMDIPPAPVSSDSMHQLSNFYMNPGQTPLPLPSVDGVFASNGINSTSALKTKVQDILDPQILSGGIHPSLLKSKIHELMDPHILSNAAWQQGVGLQTEPNFGSANTYCGSSQSQEMQPGNGDHPTPEPQWSDDMVDGSCGGGTRMIDSANGGQFNGNTELDIGQLAALADHNGLPSDNSAKSRDEALMWSLDEHTKEMSSTFQPEMLADETMESALPNANDGNAAVALKPAVLEEVGNVGMLAY